jgi:hypothetical protein
LNTFYQFFFVSYFFELFQFKIHCTSPTWEKLRKKELHSSWTAVHTMDIENVVSWLGATTAHRCSTYRKK